MMTDRSFEQPDYEASQDDFHFTSCPDLTGERWPDGEYRAPRSHAGPMGLHTGFAMEAFRPIRDYDYGEYSFDPPFGREEGVAPLAGGPGMEWDRPGGCCSRCGQVIPERRRETAEGKELLGVVFFAVVSLLSF